LEKISYFCKNKKYMSSTLQMYQEKIRQMFFISIKNDLDKWTLQGNDYFSPEYGDIKLDLDIKRKCLYLNDNNTNFTCVTRYQLWIIPVDFKVWKHLKILKKHFKKLQNDIEVEKEIEQLKNGLSKLEEKYIKEVRKEKLGKIKKDA
jgi:hypothetical protein